MSRISALTSIEQQITHQALQYSADRERERREAERISLLAGCWEAMAVQAAMKAAVEGRAERQAKG